MNILLVAEESAGLQTLRMLLEIGHPVAAVLTSDASSSRGATVGDHARRSGISVLPSDFVRDRAFANWITDHDIDVLLNIHSLFVIQGEIVAAPAIGSFNLHPGPLPQYAGLNAPSWAIYNGETTHAVTLHWMDPAIDTGPVAYSAEFELTDQDSGISVSAKCVRLGLPLVKQLLDAAERNPTAIPATPQDLARRRYFGREAPQDGRIEWVRPARDVVRFVRAADYAPFRSPWGHPLLMQDGRLLGLAKAELTGKETTDTPGTVAVVPGEGVHVAAADEWVAVRRLEVAGKYARAEDVLAPGSLLGGG